MGLGEEEELGLWGSRVYSPPVLKKSWPFALKAAYPSTVASGVYTDKSSLPVAMSKANTCMENGARETQKSAPLGSRKTLPEQKNEEGREGSEDNLPVVVSTRDRVPNPKMTRKLPSADAAEV